MVAHVTAARVAGLLGSWSGSGPAYSRLAEGIRLLISDGRIPPEARLPSERELTAALGVSRTTVTGAYTTLRNRGFLASRRGAGSFVTLPAAGGHGHRGLTPGGVPDHLIDLTCAAMPAASGVAAAYEAAVEEMPALLATIGYEPLGLESLREIIAERYGRRGLPTSPDQVLVVAGGLAGVALVLRAVVETGDRVMLESPTYANISSAVSRSGVRAVSAPVAPDGWDIEVFESTLRQAAPRAAVVIPDFHNPTGALMAAEDRQALGRALARTHTMAIVDETLVDIFLDVEDRDMPPPLAAFHPSGVVCVGSTSKSFWGGLRIGWIRAPEPLVSALLSARTGLDLGAAALEQLVAERLLRDASRVLGLQRELVRARRDALMSAVRARLPEWRFVRPAGGLALWCELPKPLSNGLVAAAERHGVALVPGSRFSAYGGLERFVRLPYTLSEERLDQAVSGISQAWSEADVPAAYRPDRPLIA
ncbi:MAG: aminotransferase class I/II-fold pyridoxal phosphate-dependent enzyme [Propionibacteriales bacterium]|nr:aminotransferase class I/II-fold pyridoxal phosphate-dependent enzyme [Propionibacteriales bacterium]